MFHVHLAAICDKSKPGRYFSMLVCKSEWSHKFRLESLTSILCAFFILLFRPKVVSLTQKCAKFLWGQKDFYGFSGISRRTPIEVYEISWMWYAPPRGPFSRALHYNWCFFPNLKTYSQLYEIHHSCSLLVAAPSHNSAHSEYPTSTSHYDIYTPILSRPWVSVRISLC